MSFASHAHASVAAPGDPSGGKPVHRALALDVARARLEGTLPRAERTPALIVSVLTLACTMVSLLDLYLLASHAA